MEKKKELTADDVNGVLNVLPPEVNSSLGTRCKDCPTHPMMVCIEYKMPVGKGVDGSPLYMDRREFVCPGCGNTQSFIMNLKELKARSRKSS